MRTNVDLVKIGEKDKESFRQLMSEYLRELSTYTDDLKPNQDGLYEYDGFDLLLEKDALTPFFIQDNDQVVGFVILSSNEYVQEGINYCVQELYIKPEFRKNQIAKTAVNKLFMRFKGKYQVVQLIDNQLAIQFWRHVFLNLKIDYLESLKEVDGCKCYVQTFVV
ncbi:GNAT family N-acetyltransferase [Haloplasma contractile]|uniref:Acetyltransferase domain protein n=1 Tax=Haloplasma contractile SSD-17B TaxID=1033810 RepID=F7PV90_9MOLU|nr:GNAT family N-acetyltransferase [Haloplasma contractile]ERJ12946.1 Acetyltransferase domain protein [Haloplasma contractile SSD-17B]